MLETQMRKYAPLPNRSLGSSIVFMLLMICSLSAQATDVRQRLLGYEWQLDPDVWTQQVHARTELIAIVEDSDEVAYVRARALAVLSLYPDQAVWDLYLDRLLEADLVGRRRLVDAICQAFAVDRAGAVEELLIPYLAESDAHLRLRAATCLRTIGSKGTLEALSRYRARLNTSSQAWEKGRLDAPAN